MLGVSSHFHQRPTRRFLPIVFLALGLSFSLFNANANANANSADMTVDLPVVFELAPKNTPYSLVANLSFQEPPSTFVYGTEHPDQYAAYWPAANANAKSQAKGLVVFIHGGCWLSVFDMSHSYAFATGLSQAGYHVWSIEYRRAGNGGEWPVALNDIKLGLAKLAVLNELNVDMTNISIIGHSAGGHLAAMLGVQLDDVLPSMVQTADIIGLAAIIDVNAYAMGGNSCQSATPSFMGGMPNEKAAAYYLATPSNFAVKGERLGKFTLLQGDTDAIVPPSQASHSNAKTSKLEGVGHFDWIHPGSDAFKHLLEQLKNNKSDE